MKPAGCTLLLIRVDYQSRLTHQPNYFECNKDRSSPHTENHFDILKLFLHKLQANGDTFKGEAISVYYGRCKFRRPTVFSK